MGEYEGKDGEIEGGGEKQMMPALTFLHDSLRTELKLHFYRKF